MPELPFDPEYPPEDPPGWVPQPMLWRLAARLHRDHEPVPGYHAEAGCRTCGERWPCRPRRLAERGLIVAAGLAGPDPRDPPAPGMIREFRASGR